LSRAPEYRQPEPADTTQTPEKNAFAPVDGEQRHTYLPVIGTRLM
jgi:hypothetical protein